MSETILSLDAPVTEEIITIISNDNVEYNVVKNYLTISNFLNNALELDTEDNKINVDIKSSILTNIITYIEYHKGIPGKIPEQPLRSKNLKDVIDEWDADFINNISGKEDTDPVKRQALYDLINACNYLDMKCLLHIGCAKIASLIKGQPIEKIKDILACKDDKKEN